MEDKKYTAYFDRFEIELTLEDALEFSHPNRDAYPYIEQVWNDGATKNYIMRQIIHIDPRDIKRELLEWGAWEEEELESRKDSTIKIIWIAAGNIREEYHE